MLKVNANKFHIDNIHRYSEAIQYNAKAIGVSVIQVLLTLSATISRSYQGDKEGGERLKELITEGYRDNEKLALSMLEEIQIMDNIVKREGGRKRRRG